ncbi:hypothetical protein GCM10023115_46910 [Pontixanthobacter gangjinensis]|uniref:DUF4595 domain-containing protein n=1 Tax=Christiangramia aestuarii TaxID=1028746 RepID=A0A7M3SX86_9FLAO|nr:hypothetical protein [Christiangramia aestuarii]MUP41217.1 hypothetical protein [Christiangramia aestuarii]
MKALLIFRYLLLIAVYSACSTDDEASSNDLKQYTVIRFGESQNISENGGQQEVILPFDSKTISVGEIQLKLESNNELNLRTVPEILNGILSIQVQAGASHASFFITPEDDEIVTNMQKIVFSIYALSGNLIKANNNQLVILLSDDELMGMPRAYHTRSNEGSETKEFFYDNAKQLITVETEVISGFGWKESSQYFYSEDGNLIKVISVFDEDPESNLETLYYWKNGNIHQTVNKYDGISFSYTNYDYDQNGNLIASSAYDKDELGNESLEAKSSYEYYSDGRLKTESTTFYFDEELNYKINYDNYLPVLNPFTQILPGVNAQKGLPGLIEYKFGEDNYSRIYTYEFGDDGKLTKRKATGETTTYSYH